MHWDSSTADSLLPSGSAAARTGNQVNNRDLHNKQPMIGVFFNIPPRDYDALKSAAEECRDSVSGFCRQAVSFYLSHLETEALK